MLLTNSPATIVPLRLECRKSFALGVKFTRADGNTLDITDCTLQFVMARQVSGLVMATKELLLLDPTVGVAQLVLDGTDTDLPPGVYDASITLLTSEGYSAAAVKFETEIVSNPDPATTGVYAGGGFTTAISVAIGEQQQLTVRQATLPPVGTPGPPGPSAYDVAVSNGFVGDEPDWLDSLIGLDGDDGDDGLPGPAGNTIRTTAGAPAAGTGVNGDYAYDPTAKVMYGPKAAGAWPAGVALGGGLTAAQMLSDPVIQSGMPAWAVLPNTGLFGFAHPTQANYVANGAWFNTYTAFQPVWVPVTATIDQMNIDSGNANVANLRLGLFDNAAGDTPGNLWWDAGVKAIVNGPVYWTIANGGIPAGGKQIPAGLWWVATRMEGAGAPSASLRAYDFNQPARPPLAKWGLNSYQGGMSCTPAQSQAAGTGFPASRTGTSVTNQVPVVKLRVLSVP